MLVLVIGPDFRAMRGVLERARSLTTDIGGEFLVRDVHDCRIGFFKAIHAHVPRNAVVQNRLFPMCVASAGWHHVFDGLLRFGLCQLKWFGSWLEQTKGG